MVFTDFCEGFLIRVCNNWIIENIMAAYPRHIIDVARRLRQHPTEAEEILWQQLRNRKLLGLKFGRQHTFGRYVADFYCAELQLVIELEGGIHEIENQREYDHERFEALKSLGLTVLRIPNEDVLNHFDEVLQKIVQMKTRNPHPRSLSRLRERDVTPLARQGEGNSEKIKQKQNP